MANEFSSLVFTNDNCIGCNKCIGACSCVGACVSHEVNGTNRIDADSGRQQIAVIAARIRLWMLSIRLWKIPRDCRRL